jgi:hypothetical protein
VKRLGGHDFDIDRVVYGLLEIGSSEGIFAPEIL